MDLIQNSLVQNRRDHNVSSTKYPHIIYLRKIASILNNDLGQSALSNGTLPYDLN